MTVGQATHRPKVVHMTTVHAPFDVRIFQKECRSLVLAGYDVVLLAPHTQDEVAEGVRLKALPRFANRAYRMSRGVLLAAAEALRQNGDVYHFHDCELVSAGLLLAARGKRVIYDIHEDVPADILHKTYLPHTLRWPIAATAKVFLESTVRCFSALVTATTGITNNYCTLHPRVITVRNFPLREEYTASASSWNRRANAIAYAGGLTPKRGIRQLVEAMALLPAELGARLKLAGGLEQPTFGRELRNLQGWERVDEMGMLDREALVTMLGTVRAGLLNFLPLPNHVNAEPNKLFEYMAAGLPVIASDFPLWRQIVTSTGCGLLVDPEQPAAIAEAVRYILTHPAEAEEMGRRGQRAVQQHYNWGTQERVLLDLYADLVGAACGEPARAVA